MPSWVNGVPEERLSIRDRGLAYGDGLFETLAVRAGRIPLLPRHMARLTTGSQRLALDLELTLIERELLAFAAELGEGVAKLMVTRGEGLRGYAPPQPCVPLRILQGSPLPAYPKLNAEQGVRLFPCTTRLAEQPLLAGLKHLSRLEQVLARAEWQDAEHAEGLMCDTSGRVIEGVYSNLFLVSGGVLLTPDLSRCGVAGVMRAEILEQGARLGITCQIRDVEPGELLAADEVFLCNSLYGIWPVRRLQEQHWPLGPLTRKLQGSVRHLLEN